QDNLIGNTHADILSGGDDGDVLTGPAASISGGAGNDLMIVVLDTADPVVLDGGGGTNDELRLYATAAADTMDMEKGTGASRAINFAGTPRTVTGVEKLLVDGRGGGDTFIVGDLAGAGLSSLELDLGHRIVVSGTKIETTTLDSGATVSREVPN